MPVASPRPRGALIALALLLLGCRALTSSTDELCAAPPTSYQPPATLLKIGATCHYNDDCVSSLCVPAQTGGGKLCTSVGSECTSDSVPAGFVGQLVTQCLNDEGVASHCVPSSAAAPECAAQGQCCDLGSACRAHKDCCSAWCYVPSGRTTGACVAEGCVSPGSCPINHRCKTWAKTDPVVFCVPDPAACTGSECHVEEVAVSTSTGCLRRAKGDVFCWGSKDRPFPSLPMPGLADIVQIDGGFGGFCGVRRDGQVLCWKDAGTPSEVFGVTGATQVSVGWNFTCALVSGGRVKCWGVNDHGELGDGTLMGRESPAEVAGLSDITQVSAGFQAGCALHSSGQVLCWGSQALMLDTVTAARPIPDLPDAVHVDAGVPRCAVRRNGQVLCGVSTPGLMPGVSDGMQVTSDYGQACVARQNGQVTCWQLTNNVPGAAMIAQEAYDGPAKEAAARTLTDVRQIGGSVLRCVVKNSGEVRCAGSGGLGDISQTTKSDLFVLVAGTHPGWP